jgi:hypothetical protein
LPGNGAGCGSWGILVGPRSPRVVARRALVERASRCGAREGLALLLLLYEGVKRVIDVSIYRIDESHDAYIDVSSDNRDQ